jgi:hypothetical protein
MGHRLDGSFFFRAEDFGDLISSIDREDSRIHETLSDLVREIADEAIKQMKESTNF